MKVRTKEKKKKEKERERGINFKQLRQSLSSHYLFINQSKRKEKKNARG